MKINLYGAAIGATIDDIELDAKRFPSFYGDPATRVN